ncbi:hypothetical protein EV426DRAFT_323355 [Tirmania nivea]|nr:hypothetical protein EV426DRAFT_323355 [Tirmania nivea]
MRSSVLVFGVVVLHLVAASPAPTPTVTVTVSKCPHSGCRKICATPTATAEPTGECPFDLSTCPVAMCLSVPAITSTSTKYCHPDGCSDVRSTACDKLLTATVIPPCPTACPELCPIPITTVAVACTTSSTKYQ